MKSINESQEVELLDRLMNFYKKRYSEKSSFEKKFNDAVQDLISTGDIKKNEYIKFCIDNDIEPIIPNKPSTSNYTSSGCGSSGYSSSRC